MQILTENFYEPRIVTLEALSQVRRCQWIP